MATESLPGGGAESLEEQAPTPTEDESVWEQTPEPAEEETLGQAHRPTVRHLGTIAIDDRPSTPWAVDGVRRCVHVVTRELFSPDSYLLTEWYDRTAGHWYVRQRLTDVPTHILLVPRAAQSPLHH